MIRLLKEDFKANRGNFKGRLFCTLYRAAHASLHVKTPLRQLLAPVRWAYRFVCEGFLGIEIPPKVVIGGGLTIRHGFGIVVNSNAAIGARAVMRHEVTVGNRRAGERRGPQVGDDVDFGVGSTVLGDIVIGNGATIGAGAVVLIDVPEGGLAVGVPATVRHRTVKADPA